MMCKPPKPLGVDLPRPGWLQQHSAAGFASGFAASTGIEQNSATLEPFCDNKGCFCLSLVAVCPAKLRPSPEMTKCPLVNCRTDRLELKVLIYMTMALTAQ